MSPTTEHISDVELVLAANGELPAACLAVCSRHIATCDDCQSRLSAFEGALGEYFDSHRELLNQKIQDREPAQAAFRRRLEGLAHGERTNHWSRWLPTRNMSRPAIAGVCLAVACAAVSLFRAPEAAEPRFAPNAALTPGLTRPVTVAELCGAGAPEERLEVSRATALEVFRRHGIDDPPAGAYELDYLIPPELGGARDDRNLWPQPYQERPWNAHSKDALEDHLRRLVCGGELDLRVAQQEIANDWTVAYQKYFHTLEPLVSHATFLKDSPWQ